MRQAATWYNTRSDKLQGSYLGRLDFEAMIEQRKPKARPSRAANEAAAAKRREQYMQEREARRCSR